METIDKIISAFDGEEEVIIVVSDKMKNKIDECLKKASSFPPSYGKFKYKGKNIGAFYRAGIEVYYTSNLNDLK